MANTIQTATLRMLLQDDLSANAAKVAASLKGVAGAEAGLVRESERLGLASKKLEQFDKVRATFAASRTAFNEARANVERLAKSFNDVDAPSAKMRKEFERAKKEVSASAAAFEKQKARLVETKRAYEELAGGPLKNVVTAQANLRRQTEETTAAIKRQVAASIEAAEREAVAAKAKARAAASARRSPSSSGGGGAHGDTSTVAGLASLYIGHEFAEGVSKAIEQYREFDKERRYGGVVMGLSYEQQKPLIEQAIRGGGTSKFNDIQWLESQRELAARGYSEKQVLAFTPIAAQLATALDKSMPEAVKLLEGSLLGFGKDTSTFDKAVAAARRTADLQVKASKISGMGAEDVEALYKRGAAPARMAGMSEESMLAFGAISKKANLSGDEASTAFRALVKDLMSPTAEARTAMAASGVNFGNYQTAPPKPVNLPGFVTEVARKYGVQLDHGTITQLGSLFSNKDALADPAAFTPAVTQLLRGSLGGTDAKSLKSIAGLAGRYRDDSMGKVDVDRLMHDVMEKMAANPALANSIFGGKNGGKIFSALGDPAFFKKIFEELLNESQGYTAKVSDARMAGFDGAMSMLQGSMLNLEGAFGRAFDNDGKGGFLADATREAAAFTQALAEADPAILRMAGTAAAGVAALAGLKGLGWIKGGFGLQRSATHLDESAIQLKEAATMLGRHGGSAPGGPGAAPGEGTKSGVAEVPKGVPKGGILGDAGFKGVASGLSEGVIGAMVYEAGSEALRYFEDHVLRFTDADRERIDKLHPGKDLDDQLGNLVGRVTDKTGPADAYLGGDRAAIEERARRAATDFRREPETVRGRALGTLPLSPEMMESLGLARKPGLAEALPVPAATPDEPDEAQGAEAPAAEPVARASRPNEMTPAERALLRAAGRDVPEPVGPPPSILRRGFSEGGYTGSGGRTEAAGIVHREEFVVKAGPATRYRAMLEAMNAGTINVPIGGGSIDAARAAVASREPARVSLTADSSSASWLRAIVEQGTYDALRRIGGEGDRDITGNGEGGGTANLRYGRGAGGGYRGTPGTGQNYETGPHVALGKMGAKFAEKAPVIMDGLMKKYGLTREQAAGVVGNLGHESGGFTKFHEGGKAPNQGGVGWAQWTGPRRRAFEAWTQAHALNPTSDEASWRYLTEGDPETGKAIAAVKRQSTVGGSMQAFEGSFERAGIKAYGSRMGYANAAMNMRPGGAAVMAPASAEAPPSASSVGAHLADLKKAGVLSDEQCVTLAMAGVGIRKGSGVEGANVHDWLKGPAAGSGRLISGTPVATFLNRDGSQSDRYAGGGAGTPGAHLDHAGLFQEYMRNEAGKVIGMKIAEQYQGSGGTHIRDYLFGKGSGEGNASNYFAVRTRQGYLGGTANPMSGNIAEARAERSQNPADAPGRAVDIANDMAGADEKVAATKLGHYMSHGEWCADFVNGVLGKAGIKGTGSSMSDSFRKWGTPVDRQNPKKGDVIVEYGKGIDGEKLGHAGIFNGKVKRAKDGEITGYGMVSGNHDDKVIKDYWEDATRVTELRRATERSFLSRRPPAAAGESPLLPRRQSAPAAGEPMAMNGGLSVDHASVREAIHHVRTLKQELASLGTAHVGVTHRGFGTHGGHAPGAVRTALNGGFASDGRAFS